jgi:tetratricopeptide (TPR) repeat protein
MGLTLGLSGRRDEALEYTGRGIELEPYNAIVRTSSAWASARAGDFETAMQVLSRAIELAPDSAYALWSYGQMLRYLERYDESVEVLEKLVESSGRTVPFYIALLGGTFAAAGERDKAEQLLGELQNRRASGEYVPSRELASILVTLGHHEEAVVALERARDERNAILWSWIYLPEFVPLRADPRWQRLARRLGRAAPMAPGM